MNACREIEPEKCDVGNVSDNGFIPRDPESILSCCFEMTESSRNSPGLLNRVCDPLIDQIIRVRCAFLFSKLVKMSTVAVMVVINKYMYATDGCIYCSEGCLEE